MYKGYIQVIEEMTLLRHYYIEMDLHKEFSRRPFFKHLRPSRGLKRAPRDNLRWEILWLFYLINCVLLKKKVLVYWTIRDLSFVRVCEISCLMNASWNHYRDTSVWGIHIGILPKYQNEFLNKYRCKISLFEPKKNMKIFCVGLPLTIYLKENVKLKKIEKLIFKFKILFLTP